MKVALVLFDWFAHGGLQRDCTRIGERLLKAEVQVDLICMESQGILPGGMQKIQPVLQGSSKVTRRYSFVKQVQDITSNNAYDLVLGFNRMPGLDFYFAADTCFAWKARHERNWLYRLAPRNRQYLAFEEYVFGPHSKTKIFMLSPGQKEEYLACYPQSAHRLIDIPPGIERNRMADESAEALRQSCRQEFGVGDEELLLLQVGSGFSIKGVERSLAALASLPESLRSKTRLFVIGRDKAEPYMKIADNLGIGEAVTFIQTRDDLPRFFQGADLLLHPSHKESAGMVILEAIVAGLPVLTTAACGYAFHVIQAEAGRVIDNPFDQQILNETLCSMLSGDKRAHWKQKGIEYGINGDFYDMPDRVASLLIQSAGESVDVT